MLVLILHYCFVHIGFVPSGEFVLCPLGRARVFVVFIFFVSKLSFLGDSLHAKINFGGGEFHGGGNAAFQGGGAAQGGGAFRQGGNAFHYRGVFHHGGNASQGSRESFLGSGDAFHGVGKFQGGGPPAVPTVGPPSDPQTAGPQAAGCPSSYRLILDEAKKMLNPIYLFSLLILASFF